MSMRKGVHRDIRARFSESAGNTLGISKIVVLARCEQSLAAEAVKCYRRNVGAEVQVISLRATGGQDGGRNGQCQFMYGCFVHYDQGFRSYLYLYFPICLSHRKRAIKSDAPSIYSAERSVCFRVFRQNLKMSS